MGDNPIKKVTTEVSYDGQTFEVQAVRVGLDDGSDAYPWRVDAPGEPVDGWLLTDREAFRPEAAG
jgi:hypothetical protein